MSVAIFAPRVSDVRLQSGAVAPELSASIDLNHQKWVDEREDDWGARRCESPPVDVVRLSRLLSSFSSSTSSLPRGDHFAGECVELWRQGKRGSAQSFGH